MSRPSHADTKSSAQQSNGLNHQTRVVLIRSPRVRGLTPEVRRPVLVRPALGRRRAWRRLLLLLLLLLLLQLQLPQQLFRRLHLLGVGLLLWSFSAGRVVVGRVIDRLFRDVYTLHSLFIHLKLAGVLNRRHGRRNVGHSAGLRSQYEPIHAVRMRRRTQHHVVEVGSIEQRCQDIAGWPRSKVSHNPFGSIRRDLDLGPGLRPHGSKNISQRRVLGHDCKLPTAVPDLRRQCRHLRQGRRWRGRGRSRWRLGRGLLRRLGPTLPNHRGLGHGGLSGRRLSRRLLG